MYLHGLVDGILIVAILEMTALIVYAVQRRSKVMQAVTVMGSCLLSVLRLESI